MGSLLPDIPPLQELLRHPQVQQALARVNQSVVAQHATAFINELRGGAARAMGSAPANVGDLAEALVRRVLGPQPSDTPLVNATGLVFGGTWDVSPMAESAVHRMMLAASDFGSGGGGLVERVELTLASLVQAESVMVGASLESMRLLLEKHNIESVSDAPLAGLVDPAEYGLASVPTVAERLRGCGLVLFDGAGLLGGPSCGILAGDRKTTATLREGPVGEAARAGRLVMEGLLATLDIYRQSDRPQDQIPALRLLSTTAENLKQRAERLAPVIAAASSVAEAEAVETISPWCATHSVHLEGPTWAVRVATNGLAVGSALQRLRSGFCVVGRESGDQLMIDLRSVFPRWDQRLPEAFEGLSA